MKLMVLLLMVLVATGGRATATTVDAEIRRGASVFVCEQLRWAGLSDRKVADRTYRFRIVQNDGQAMLGIYSDLYDFGSARGIMDFKMARIYDGCWGVYEYGFMPDFNDSEYAKSVRARFIGKPMISVTTSRRACAGYLAETSALKSRMEAAAIRSVENFMQFGPALNKCRHEGTARPGEMLSPATQTAGDGCETKPRPANVKERVCAFNEAYSHLYVVVESKRERRVYVVAIRQDLKSFSEQFIDYDDRVVQELSPLESKGVLAYC